MVRTGSLFFGQGLLLAADGESGFLAQPMTIAPARRFCRSLLVFVLSTACVASCGGREEASSGAPPDLPPALRENRMGELSGAVYQSQASSSIPWQPWGREAFKAAGDAKRLVLVVVLMPQRQDFNAPLRELGRDPFVVEAIRRNYVRSNSALDNGNRRHLSRTPHGRDHRRSGEASLQIHPCRGECVSGDGSNHFEAAATVVPLDDCERFGWNSHRISESHISRWDGKSDCQSRRSSQGTAFVRSMLLIHHHSQKNPTLHETPPTHPDPSHRSPDVRRDLR